MHIWLQYNAHNNAHLAAVWLSRWKLTVGENSEKVLVSKGVVRKSTVKCFTCCGYLHVTRRAR